MTAADKLCPGAFAAFTDPARHVDDTDTSGLPTVRRVRRRCRCHRPYLIDVTYSDGRRCRYLPDDQIDVLEATR